MPAEVHVGDVGTLYKCRCLDEGGDFDPSGASVKELTFRLPGDVIVTRTATVTSDGSPQTKWYLTYIVVAADTGFHGTAGIVKIQGYVEWDANNKWSSDVQEVDDDGNELRIYHNL